MKVSLRCCFALLASVFPCLARAQAVPLPDSGTNLPLILINTDGGLPVPGTGDPKIGATMTVINRGPGKRNRLQDSTAETDYTGRITLNVRGESSAEFPQQPYSINTVTTSGSNNSAPVLGMPADNDWVLISLYNDRSFVRNLVAYKLSAELGHYASRSRLCEVVLNGDYRGIYAFGEKLKPGEDRIDISKMKAVDTTGDVLTGGYMIEVDYWTPVTGWASRYHPIDHPDLTVHYLYEYPKVEDLQEPQKAYLQAYIDSLETALYDTAFTDTTIGYRRYLDVRSCIDYALVNELSRNPDGYKKSYHFYKDRDSRNGRLFSGPVWDFDWAFKNVAGHPIYGQTDGSGWSYKVNDATYIDNPSPGWMVRLLQDCAFKQQLHDRYVERRSDALDLGRIDHFIDSMAAVLVADSAVARHFARWQTLGVETRWATPEVGTLPTTYAGEVEALKAWIHTRVSWLDANLPAACSDSTGRPQPASALLHTELEVYPQPVAGTLHVRFPTANGAQAGLLILYNTTGQAVFQTPIDCSQDRAVALPDLAAGVYSLRIVAGATNSNAAIDFRSRLLVAPR